MKLVKPFGNWNDSNTQSVSICKRTKHTIHVQIFSVLTCARSLSLSLFHQTVINISLQQSATEFMVVLKSFL